MKVSEKASLSSNNFSCDHRRKRENGKSINIKLGSPFITSNTETVENPDRLNIRNLTFKRRISPNKQKCIGYRKCQISDKKRVIINEDYGAILLSILPSGEVTYSDFKEFIEIPERTLKRHLAELERLKWLIRVRYHGRLYMVNPLIQFLIDNGYCGLEILDYASYQIDLFKLLSQPLTLIDKPIEFYAKVLWQKNPFGTKKNEVLEDEPKIWSIFNGILYVWAKMKNGLEIQTFLPINARAQIDNDTFRFYQFEA